MGGVRGEPVRCEGVRGEPVRCEGVRGEPVRCEVVRGWEAKGWSEGGRMKWIEGWEWRWGSEGVRGCRNESGEWEDELGQWRDTILCTAPLYHVMQSRSTAFSMGEDCFVLPIYLYPDEHPPYWCYEWICHLHTSLRRSVTIDCLLHQVLINIW